MKVAFVIRGSVYTSPGGDTVQALATAKYLRRLGVEVDLVPANQQVDRKKYDLVHFFNLIRPDDILRQLRGLRVPYVVSSIYVEYRAYEEGGTLQRLSNFGHRTPDQLEYIKRMARWLLNGESFPTAYYLFKGHRKSIQKVLEGASCVLPNSVSEGKRLVRDHGYAGRLEVIPNGIDPEVFPAISSQTREPGLVVCAGRIEPRKNQLNLIRALRDTPYRLEIIGDYSPNHRAYFEQCKLEAGQAVTFSGSLSQTALAEKFSLADVHALPSRFETTGLSSLEAAWMGCKLVVSPNGDTRDYFGDMAFYCDPESPGDIRRAVEAAVQSKPGTALVEKIRNAFTWEIAAQKTHHVYLNLLNKA